MNLQTWFASWLENAVTIILWYQSTLTIMAAIVIILVVIAILSRKKVKK